VAEKTIEGYIASKPAPLAEVLTQIDAIVRKAAPKATATIKWAQPVYELNGPFAYMKATAKHVTFGFWRGTELTDPKRLLEGDGERMKHVKVTSPADVRTSQFAAWVKEAVRLNSEKGNPTQRKA
jgi:hypothetical protein